MNKKNFLHLMAIMMAAMLSVGFASCSSDDDNDEKSYHGKVNFDYVCSLLGSKYDEIKKANIGVIKEEEKTKSDAKIITSLNIDNIAYSATFLFDTNYSLYQINLDQSQYLDYSDNTSRFNMFKSNVEAARKKYGEPIDIIYMPRSEVVSIAKYHYSGYDNFWNNIFNPQLTNKIYFTYQAKGHKIEYCFYPGIWDPTTSVNMQFGIIVKR